MSKLESIAILALIDAVRKVGETLVDGERHDDFNDIVNALLGLFGLSDDKENCEEKE